MCKTRTLELKMKYFRETMHGYDPRTAPPRFARPSASPPARRRNCPAPPPPATITPLPPASRRRRRISIRSESTPCPTRRTPRRRTRTT
ncbi:Adenylate cyclase [Thauera humireducens]|nr:Adenylate cyclase [Thauera humireducens]